MSWVYAIFSERAFSAVLGVVEIVIAAMIGLRPVSAKVSTMLLLTANAYHWWGGQQKTMVLREICPRCGSPKDKRNGHIHNGKQHHQCQDCGRQCVTCVEPYLIADDTRALIERLPVERISWRGISRAVGVRLKWLLGFLVICFEDLPDHWYVQPVLG
jgi:transposase-like protein